MKAQDIAKENFYRTRFEQIENHKCGVAWLKMLRENAIDRFSEIGFPTVEQEDWKYTNVQPIAKESFNLPTASESVDAEEFERFSETEAGHTRLVFANGRFRAELSSLADLPSGVVVENLAAAFGDETVCSIAKQHLARLVDYETNGFTALNTAFLTDGAFIFLPKNTRVETPIHLLFVTDAEQIAAFPRILLVAERGAEATVVESYTRTSETQYFTNAVVEIVLADEARLTHYRVQRESHRAFHVGTTNVSLQRGSFYDSTNIMLGAVLSRHDVNVTLNREGAECFVDGLYLVGETQHADTHSIIDHRVPNCTSHQTYKGILDGKSRAVFNGKIFVRENASGTNGYQSNKNLLLSNDARVDTKPQLEIFNDDVKCSHGATVGQLEDEEVFYLLSRGLSPALARNLLTYGFAEEVINKIEIESIKTELDASVLNRLDAKF